MTVAAPIKIKWRNRDVPLAPCALIAFGGAALSLAEKLLSFDDERLKGFQGVGGKQTILIAGAGETLPWTNGAIYLGRDARLPAALLPTTLEPNIPLELFEQVLKIKFKSLAPFVVLPEKIVPVGKAKILSRRVLEIWLADNR